MASAEAPAAGATDAARLRLEREYAAAFLPHGLVPVLLPLGHETGDVIAALGGGFVARRDECFDGLVPREAPSSLTSIELSWSAAARFGLGIDGVAEAEAQGKTEDIVQVRFDQVVARSASLLDLRRRLRPDVLPEVKRLLSGKAEAAAAPDWLLIGEVLSAVTIVRVSRSRQGGGKASLSFVGALAERLGLKAKAEGGGDLSRADKAEISTQQALPVAFRPALVRVTPDLAQRFRDVPPEEFLPANETHRKALEAWVTRTTAAP